LDLVKNGESPELIGKLQLEPVKIMNSRNHCEVMRCRSKKGQDLVLKFLKWKKKKHNFQKEIDILNKENPKGRLRFPRLVDFGPEYIVTEFDSGQKLNIEKLDQKQINLLIQALIDLRSLPISSGDSPFLTKSSFWRTYIWRLFYNLSYLVPEYLNIFQALRCLSIIISAKRYFGCYSVHIHGSFEADNIILGRDSDYVLLVDFENFSLKDTFWYDVLYLCCEPCAFFEQWTWQKTLIAEYWAKLRTDNQFRISPEGVKQTMRMVLLTLTLQQMGMQRISDEEKRFFRKMSPAFLLSRGLLKILRILKIIRPLKMSPEMKARINNMETLINKDSFSKLYQDLIEK
ncbi:phosphotransferase, partial [Candidatus Omnitrophota bacterium]